MTSRSVAAIQADLTDVRRYLVDVPPHSGQGLRDDLLARVGNLERELAGARRPDDDASPRPPLSDADLGDLLTRIGATWPDAPTADVLHALHRAYVTTVPFENLDIVDGTPIDLAIPALVAKVVVRRRGGFCYELNGLFAAALTTIGFDVVLVAAHGEPSGTPHAAFDHLRLLVTDHTGSRWLADVGNGASWPAPLSLVDGAEQDLGHGHVRLVRDGDEWRTDTRVAGEATWDPEWWCDETPRDLHEFTARCRWHEQDPTSHFTQGLVCTRTIAGGKLTVTDDRLIVTLGTEREEQPIEDLDVTLIQHFGIRREHPAS